VSIIAAGIIAVIALFLTAPLEFIPSAALGVVLIIASIHLLDLKAIWLLKRKDKQAFYLALATLFAVLFIGVIPGITLAVLLGLFQFIRTVMRPTDNILGVDIKGVVRSLDATDKAKSVQGVFIYRFNSPLTYFNAGYFKRRLLEQYARQKDDTQCVIIDAVPCFTHLDLSVMAMLADLDVIFKKRGIRLELAGRKRQLLSWFEIAGMTSGKDGIYVHSDLYIALQKNSVSQPSAQVNLFTTHPNEGTAEQL
jgi:MFS superfamily sulfate permease-like transporter